MPPDIFNPIPAAILDWMESSWLNSFMYAWPWTWVTFETLHFIGMAMLIGPIIVMDLRVLGFDSRRVGLHTIHRFIPITLTGFGINLITGVMFFFGNPYRYAINISFQLKMLLVLLAGVNALYFWKRASGLVETGEPATAVPVGLKAAGLASLLLWFGVLSFGRLIPYLGTG